VAPLPTMDAAHICSGPLAIPSFVAFLLADVAHDAGTVQCLVPNLAAQIAPDVGALCVDVAVQSALPAFVVLAHRMAWA
jgi:hypothetical protein